MNTKTCPTCNAENPADATICIKCGASLVAMVPSNTTVRVPDPPAKPSSPQHIVELTKQNADALIFQVLGHEQPVLIKGHSKVLIGRFTPGEPPPTIDLNSFNGAILGVSRQHAQIQWVENGYTVQDLGSTNGTWLNEARLTPHQSQTLNNGDLLRMGQLGAYVYFRTETTDQPIEETIFLSYPTESANAFDWSARSWSQTLVPYLTALGDLQTICNELRNQPTTLVAFHSITHDAELNSIKIVATGVTDALKQLKVARTKQQELAPAVAHASTNGSTASQPEIDSNKAAEILPEISSKIVAELAPSLAEAEQKAITERLQTVLQTLLNHPLKLLTH